jgi:hypothetical protein
MTIMTSNADTVALLERALEQTAAIIAAIPASQAGLATPCPGWDVAALVHWFGRDPDWTPPGNAADHRP